jgi:hypothetical protein
MYDVFLYTVLFRSSDKFSLESLRLFIILCNKVEGMTARSQADSESLSIVQDNHGTWKLKSVAHRLDTYVMKKKLRKLEEMPNSELDY